MEPNTSIFRFKAWDLTLSSFAQSEVSEKHAAFVPMVKYKDSAPSFCKSEVGTEQYSETSFPTYQIKRPHIPGNVARGSLVVKVLGYKAEGLGLEIRLGEMLNLPNPSGRSRPWGLLSL
jgi:hypothetical protein